MGCTQSKYLYILFHFTDVVAYIYSVLVLTYSLFSLADLHVLYAPSQNNSISQGANTGFEGARILTKALKDCKGEWTKGLQAYEKAHKPRADLIQSFANLTGCGQSQQKDILPKEVLTQMLEWINTADESNLPSDDVLNTIRSFDPLAEEGVSLI